MSLGGEAIRLAVEKLSENVFLTAKAGRNFLFPRDFEYYMCGLELTDIEGNTIDYFIFPVMPNSINKVESNRISVYRTFGGVTILGSDSPTTDKITLQGNFGRSFRIVLNGSNLLTRGFKALKFSMANGVYSDKDVNSDFATKLPLFLPTIKTGFGCVKMMQSIISKAASADNGKPFRLYFYNPSLSESYLVVPSREPLQLSQDVNSTNMIWSYTLQLEIIASLGDIIFEDKAKTNATFMSSSVIQNVVHSTARTAFKLGLKAERSIVNKIKDKIEYDEKRDKILKKLF